MALSRNPTFSCLDGSHISIAFRPQNVVNQNFAQDNYKIMRKHVRGENTKSFEANDFPLSDIIALIYIFALLRSPSSPYFMVPLSGGGQN